MRAIAYFDLANNKIVIKKVDEKELNQDFEGDISAYAEAFAPSNTCEWMEINDKTKLEIDPQVKEALLPLVLLS